MGVDDERVAASYMLSASEGSRARAGFTDSERPAVSRPARNA